MTQHHPADEVQPNTDRQFPGYPEGYLLAHFADRDIAEEAIDRISGLGVSTDDIVRYEGSGGAQIIDSTGTEHGIVGAFVRAVEWVVSDEDHLAMYEEKVRAGGTVLAFRVPDEDLRHRAVDILMELGATDVKHFGRMQVEVIRR